jgi:D-glycero-alpha-D-manno-heptose-7-phosphate kinase
VIVTRTPLRITLGGGGTDLPSYYRSYGGFVFAMGIDSYIHVMVNRPTVGTAVRVAHSRVETVERVAELEHDLAREALLHHGIEDRVDVSSAADLPAGTGLGSSGAYLVGLLAALYADRAAPVSPATLAEEACTIELDGLRKTVGKQDQYMAAYGGLTVLDIARDGAVDVRSVSVAADAMESLIENTHLYYTGVRRSATAVLHDQDAALSAGAPAPSDVAVAESLHRIRELGERSLAMIERSDIDGWGRSLHEHWEHKKRLSSRISLGVVDTLYEHVRAEYGVLGGKIAGAGGGGFLMLYCPAGAARLEAFMAEQGMQRLRYRLAPVGAEVVAS